MRKLQEFRAIRNRVRLTNLCKQVFESIFV